MHIPQPPTVLYSPNTNIHNPKQIYIFLNPAAEGRTDTLQLIHIPQLLAENIQYLYIFKLHMTRFKNGVRSYCKSQTNLKVVKWG